MFGLGFLTFIAGLLTVLAREYFELIQLMTANSAKLSAQALTEQDVSGTLDSASHLLDSVARLVQTGIGVGAFLCLLGLGTCFAGFWMLPTGA